jgi:hypothetical protein
MHCATTKTIKIPKQGCRYVTWKTKIYHILLEPLFAIHNSSHFKGVPKKKKPPAGFLFTKERQVIYGLGKTKLARLHPNFNYELTSEMTLKRWKGGEKTAE